MAELLANVAIAEKGYPVPYFIIRWRTVARALPTWRPLPALTPIHDDAGNPTKAYQNLFRDVFGIGIDPKNAIVDLPGGTPSKIHRDIWRMIP